MANVDSPPSGECYVFNVQSGMAMSLDPSGNIKDDKTKVQGRAFNGQNIQKWVFEPVQGTTGYSIKNVASGTYVGFARGQQAEKDQVVTGNANVVTHDLVGDAGTGYLIIPNYRPTFALDLQGGSRTDGTPVMYGNLSWGAQNQRWKFVAA
ncbi:hypothetical protein RhiTH_010474 [Rhizoctonia solani]|uniref:Ricin B lectin domain-containing protein n=1 Tax=Rhizoctonia solani TaxID=456999 RepID=A0A8H7I5R0_9AGAM|nr:hypothetical protein RHS01_09230 [Rhizoctonia solani]